MQTLKQAYYFDLIVRWQESGLNQKAFCAQYEVKLSTFQYWMGKYRKADPNATGGFVPLHTEDSGLTEIIYPNGVRILLAAHDQARIAQLIALW